MLESVFYWEMIWKSNAVVSKHLFSSTCEIGLLCIHKLNEEALEKFCTLIEVYSYVYTLIKIVIVYAHREIAKKLVQKLHKEMDWCREIILSANSHHDKVHKALDQNVTFVKFSENAGQDYYSFATGGHRSLITGAHQITGNCERLQR